MEQQLWSRKYDQFLQEATASGRLQQRVEPEQRAHPRFRMGAKVIWTSGDFQFSIVDLAVGGICFDANRAMPVHSDLRVQLSDIVSADARVLSATELETTPMFLAGRWRMRCRFTDTLEGMRFLVMVKDMKQLRIEP